MSVCVREWLLTYEEDTDFAHMFEARREGDKRSKASKNFSKVFYKVFFLYLLL